MFLFLSLAAVHEQGHENDTNHEETTKQSRKLGVRPLLRRQLFVVFIVNHRKPGHRNIRTRYHGGFIPQIIVRVGAHGC